jgi:hypothetical protein
MVRVAPINHTFFLIIVQKIGICKSLHVPCKFYVLFWEMIIISNHTKKMFIILRLIFMYFKLKLCSIHHICYTPYICDKTLLTFWKFKTYFEFSKNLNSAFFKLSIFKNMSNSLLFNFFYHQLTFIIWILWKSFVILLFWMKHFFIFKSL